MANKLITIKLADGVWQFAECNDAGFDFVDAYLVCGTKRAVLIDALCTVKGLYGAARKITALPLDVILTHGHGDHTGASLDEFKSPCKIFIDPEDIFLSESLAELKNLKPLTDGQVFNLGGRSLETIKVAGHTPGSVTLFDKKNELLFTGDTVGSGNFWMQLPESLPLDVFEKNLSRLHEKLCAHKNLILYVGHRSQGSMQMTGRYLTDVLAATKRIINGSLKGRASVMKYDDLEINYKITGVRMIRGYCYDPEKIVSKK